jgi:hypothetical protein
MIDMVRQRYGRRRSKVSRVPVPRDDLFYAGLRCPNQTPEQLSAGRSTRSRLDWAIDKLPKKQRVVIQLSFFEQLNGPAVALRLGIHESRVSQLKRAALLHLRDLLAATSLGPHEAKRPQEENRSPECKDERAQVLSQIENQRQALLERSHSGRNGVPLPRRRRAAGQAQSG